jgi:hypothetical protein
MPHKALLLSFAALLLASPAMAQGQNNFNANGVVDKADATSITIKNNDSGMTETYKLAPKLQVMQNQPATLADIKPNDYVASAAIKGADGKLHSTELRIFPEAMRGIGEGQRPMNDAKGQIMTNATVSGTVMVSGSNDIKVKLPSGESELILDPGVPVTKIIAVDQNMVKQGAKVRIQGPKTDDGVMINRITLQ